MSFDLKGMLSQVAPTIASALGGPLAGTAVRYGLTALGITPEKNKEHEQLAEAMASATPDDLLKIKQADQDFAVKMRKLDIEVKHINQKDRASARTMFAAGGKEAQVLLSVAYTAAYGVVLYCFMAGLIKVPDSQQILFGSLIGMLTTAQVQILNFWFGSSSGSKDKSKLLGKANG